MTRTTSTEAVVCIALGALTLLAGVFALAKLDRAARFTPSRELSEAVADPDIAQTPHLRAHLE